MDFDTQDGTVSVSGAGAFAAVVGVILTVWLLGSLLFAWPFHKVDRGEVALSYGGGVVEGRHYQGLKEPGGLFFNGWGDKLYRYPTTQRNYIISEAKHEGDVPGADSVKAVTSDSVGVKFEVATYFKLNTNPATLRRFHEEIGLKYEAWESDGWDKMLNDSFRQQIENSLQETSRQYGVEQLYSDPQALRDIERDVGRELRERVAETLGGDYFCGANFVRGSDRGCGDFTFSIKRIALPVGVARAFEANRTSEIKVKTKQNEIEQRKAEAAAIRELNSALAEAGDQYVLLKAIESGKIKFWVLPNGASLTVPAPPGS